MGSIRVRFRVLCSCHCCSGLPSRSSPLLPLLLGRVKRPTAHAGQPSISGHRRRHCHCASPFICSRVVGSHCLAFATNRAHTPAGRLRRHGRHRNSPTPTLSLVFARAGMGFRVLRRTDEEEEQGKGRGSSSRVGRRESEGPRKAPPCVVLLYFFLFILTQSLLF